MKEVLQVRYELKYGYFVYSLLREKILWKSYLHTYHFDNEEQAYNKIRKRFKEETNERK